MKSQLISICCLTCPSFIKLACAGVVLLIASAGQAQNLFVTSGHNIVEITPGGGKSIFASLSGHANGLAFDSAGDLFASVILQTNLNVVGGIIKIMPGGVQSTFAIGPRNSGFGSLAFNGTGNLFVSGAYAGTLQYTPQRVPTLFAPTGLAGLAFDTDGNLFGSGGTAIYKYAPGGMRSNFAPAVSNPAGLAFNSAGDLLAVATDGHIYEYTPGGVKSTFISISSVLSGLAFNSAGDLFVTDPNQGTITEITPGGAHSVFASGLINPGAIAFQGITLPVPEPSVLGLLAVSTIVLVTRQWTPERTPKELSRA